MIRDQNLELHGWCRCVRAIFTTSARNAHKIGLLIFLISVSFNFDKIKYFTVGGMTIELVQSAQETVSNLTMQLKAEKDINANLRQINAVLQRSCGARSSTQGEGQNLDAMSAELPKLMQRQGILDYQAKELSVKTENSLQNFQKLRQNIFKMMDKYGQSRSAP